MFDFNNSQKQKFERDGFIVIEDLFSEEICDEMRRECENIVANDTIENESLVGFSTKNPNDQHMKDNYFLTSGDKIRFFWEPKAINDNGKLNRDKMLALNKIGHALHAYNPVFKKVTFDAKIKNIYRKLGFVRPVVPQSMFIFKAPNIGGEVCRHIDATFLYTSPLKLIGIWIALEDTTIHNGCLQFVPGSHKNTEVTWRMKRKYDGKNVELVNEGELSMYDFDKYKAQQIKKGSAILIDGKVHHYSEQNKSDKSRHVYTFHVVESHNCIWDQLNWLQPTEKLPFTPIYDDSC